MADLLKPKPLTIQLRDYLNLSSPYDLPWEQGFFLKFHLTLNLV